MSLSTKGNLVKILDVQAGTSKSGKAWSKQEFVINTGDQYNPEICFSLFGDNKIELIKDLVEGQEIEVSFNAYSREFQGKYYNSLDAWKVEASDLLAGQPSATATEEDDLPF